VSFSIVRRACVFKQFGGDISGASKCGPGKKLERTHFSPSDTWFIDMTGKTVQWSVSCQS